MDSIWTKVNKQKNTELNENIKRDIVVVGGGIAGYLTAYRLAESGKNVTLIEAETLFSGVTKNTTAHLEALQGYTCGNLAKKSLDKARLFFLSQIEAIDEYEKLIEKYKIDCEFKRVDSYIYAEENDNELREEFNILKSIGADAEYLDAPELLGKKMNAAVKLSNQAIFEPVKFLSALPVNFEIYENTRIKDVDFDNRILYTEKAEIRAEKIVIATNFPIINFPGWYFLRMYKSHSYAVAIDKASDIGGIYQSDSENGITFRNYGDKLIVGGLDHRSGRPNISGKYERLFEEGKTLTSNGECTHKWTANDCITFDYLPYIGYYSKNSKDIYVITGFNKWGIANAMAASMLTADMINGIDNKYEKLYSPQRKISGLFSYFINMLCTVKNLVIKPILPPVKCYKNLKNGEGSIVFYKWKKKAVYKDEQGALHICQPLCAHLKCQLEFNPDAKTWDCPCHGSVYDVDGNIITAPTVKNLEKY